MSDPDNFLSRWSRRKLEPSNETDDAPPPETSAEAKPERRGLSSSRGA